MPYYGSQTNSEFGAGTSPTPTTGRQNLATVAPAGQYDGAWEDYQREAGSYQPGQMEDMEDQLAQGSDDES